MLSLLYRDLVRRGITCDARREASIHQDSPMCDLEVVQKPISSKIPGPRFPTVDMEEAQRSTGSKNRTLIATPTLDDEEEVQKPIGSQSRVLADIPTVDTLADFPTRSDSPRSVVSDASSTQSDITSCARPVETISLREAVQARSEKLHVNVWTEGDFTFKKVLQTAPRNHGSVDLMQNVDSGNFVAVKKMPNKWMTLNAKTFRQNYPKSTEQPWWDLALVTCLQDRGFQHLCEFAGLFRDASHTYVISSFAVEGDLLAWCDSLPKAGAQRLATVKPIMRDLYTAVKSLHDLGIVHGDLSLENIVVDRDAQKDFVVKIIDFGMSSFERMRIGPIRAKPSYTAPEAYEAKLFDGFLADSFALGVVSFGIAANDYIWYSTKPGGCDRFSRAKKLGVQKCLAARKVRSPSGDRPFVDTVPDSLLETIVGLAALEPTQRMTLGEDCWKSSTSRSSVWDKAWLTEGAKRAVLHAELGSGFY